MTLTETRTSTSMYLSGNFAPVDDELGVADLPVRGKIPDALQVYENLIRKGKMLEDITFDLKEALYRFPVEVSIWQTLGDAYMRSNRLQDARGGSSLRLGHGWQRYDS